MPQPFGNTRTVRRVCPGKVLHHLDLDLFGHHLERARDVARALVRALDRDLARDLARTRDLSEVMERLLDQCQQLGQVEMYESLAALKMPSAGPPPETWEQFSNRLQTAIESQGALQRYRQLQAEVEQLAEEGRKRRAELDEDELEALIAYLQGTMLFHECLQLAYTPDRDRFEERILALPP